MQSLLCNLCYAIFAEPTLSQPLPTSKSLEVIALSNRGYALFAMQFSLCNLYRAYLEPTVANKQSTAIHCSEQPWLCSLCYASFAMQFLPSLP